MEKIDLVEKYLKEDEDATMGYHKGWYFRNIQNRKKNIQFTLDTLNKEGALTPELEDILKMKMMESKETNKEKSDMICRDCGKKFKKRISNYSEIKCPKCGSYDTDIE